MLRTFTLSLPEMHAVVGEVLERMELAIVRDEMDGEDRAMLAWALDRAIELTLEPLTRTVTRLRIVVKEGAFKKDRATASEIVAQTERAIEAQVEVAERAAAVRKAARGNGASSPAPGDRRAKSQRAAR